MLPMLAHYVLPPLSTHKLCTNRTFVLVDGRVSLREWLGARGRGAQAQGSGIDTEFFMHAEFRHTNRVSGQPRTIYYTHTLVGCRASPPRAGKFTQPSG